MTEFLFIRHGESLLNLEQDLINGRSNEIPLTTRGLHQAYLLGEYLRYSGQQFDAIFSSGALRADSTAEAAISAAGYDMGYLRDDRLLELSQGPWSGMERDKVYDAKTIAKFRLVELSGALPGAESVKDGQARIREFVDEKTSEYPDHRLLIFSHGLLIRSLVASIRGNSKQDILRMETPNVSLSRVYSTGNVLTVESVGKTVISE